jgi:hypothetical protein
LASHFLLIPMSISFCSSWDTGVSLMFVFLSSPPDLWRY